MKYEVTANFGRVTLVGDTTPAMHALITAGQSVGRDFLEHHWEEFLRVTTWEAAWWNGSGTTEASGPVEVGKQTVTREFLIRAS